MANPAQITTVRVAICELNASEQLPSPPAFRTLPVIRGTQGSLQRQFERSSVLRSDRQGGTQIGGSRFGQGTIVVPVANDPGVRMLMEGLLGGAFSSNTLKAGATLKKYQIEFRYRDGAGNYFHEKFEKCIITEATIEFPTGGGAQISFSFLANDVALDTLDTSDATYSGPSIAIQHAGSVDASDFLDDSTPIPGGESATIQITNNAAIKFAVGSGLADHVSIGDFDATADFSIYKRDATLLGHYINGTNRKLTFKTAQASETCSFILYSAKLTQATKGESDATVIEQFSAFAEYSDTDGSKFGIVFSGNAAPDPV